MSRISRLKPLRVLASLVAVSALGIMFVPGAQAAPRHADTTYTLTVHYYRPDGNYTGWNLWSWVNTQSGSDCNTVAGDSGTDGADSGAYPFTGTDAYGVYGTIQYSCPTSTMQQIGLIVRENGWASREPSPAGGNRYLNVSGTSVSDWVLSGDPNDYSSLAAANAAKYTNIKTAVVTAKHQITVSLTKNFKLTNLMAKGQGWTLNPTGKQPKGTKKAYMASAQKDGETEKSLSVVLAGTLQTDLGNATNWDGSSTVTKFHYVTNDLYEFTTTKLKPSTDYQYKAVVGGSQWYGDANGNNLDIEIDGNESVTFYFQPFTGLVWDSVNNPTQSLPSNPGSFTDKLILTFPKTTNLNSKYSYKLTGPGVPSGTFK